MAKVREQMRTKAKAKARARTRARRRAKAKTTTKAEPKEKTKTKRSQPLLLPLSRLAGEDIVPANGTLPDLMIRDGIEAVPNCPAQGHLCKYFLMSTYSCASGKLLGGTLASK